MRTYPCACGAEVVKLDGVLYAKHEKRDHYARLNRGRKAKPNKDANGLHAGMTDEQVKAELQKRLAELEQSGAIQ